MIAGVLQIEMAANISRLSSDMQQAKTVVGSSMKSIESAVTSAKSALGALGIGLSVGMFASLVRGSIDAADHLRDLSKSTDIAVENLAGLRLLARQSGGDLDGMAASINKLSQNIGKDAEKFKALGITAKDPLKAFQQLADIFVSIKDPQLRAAVGAQALGKSWSSAAPALSEGGKRIGEVIERGAALSGITREITDQADALNDKWAELTSTGGLLTRMIGPLLPLLNTLADDMLKAGDKAQGLTNNFSPLLEIMRVLVVLGSDVSFVFSTMGMDMARAIENVKLIAQGKFAESKALGELFRKDAEDRRKALDEWQKKIMALGTMPAGATPGATPSGVDPAAAAAAAARARAFLAGEKADKLAAAELMKYENALKSLEDQLGKYNNQTVEQKMVNDLARGSLKGLTVEHRQHLIEVARAVDLHQTAKIALDAYVKSMEMDAALEQEVADLMAARATKEGDAIKAQHLSLDAMKLETSLIGKSNVERETAIALRALELSGIDKYSAEYARLTEAIKNEIQARASAEALNQKNIEQIQFETKLIGLNNTEREQAIALRALELTGIDQTTDAYKKYVAEIKGAIAEKNLAEQTKTAWVGVWQDIDRTAHDTFVSIFDSGKSAFDRLRDTLKNGLYSLLYQMTLRPFLVTIATTVGGAGVAEAAFPGSSSGGGIGNLLSTGNSLYSALSGKSTGLLQNVGNFFGIGGGGQSSLAYGAGVGVAGAGGIASTVGGLGLTTAGMGAGGLIGAGGSLIGGGIAGGGIVGGGIAGGVGLVAPSATVIGAAAPTAIGLTTATTSGAIGMGAGGATAAGMAMTAIPYIGAAIAIAAALGLFGSKKTPAVGIGYQFAGDYDPSTGSVMGLSALGLNNKGEREPLSSVDRHVEKFEAAIAPVFDEFKKLAKVLNLDAGAIGRTGFDITTNAIGQAADDASKPAVAAQLANLWAEKLVPNLKDLTKEGESSLQAFARLGAEMELTEKLIEITGHTAEQAFGGVGVASLKMRDELIELMGGLQNASTLTRSYYENFFSETERLAIDLGRVNTAMTELGVTALPKTREQFRLMVEAQDLSTRSGREMFSALMQLAPAFAAVTPFIDQVAASAEAMATALAAAQDSVKSAQDTLRGAYQRQAADLGQTVEKWGAVAKTLRDYGASLVGIGPGGLSYSAASRQFGQVSGLSRAGDIDAMANLPGVAEAFREASLANSPTAVAYARDLAKIRSAVDASADAADLEASFGQQQLEALTTQVSALITINESVVSVEQAIVSLAGAMGLAETMAKAQAEAERAADEQKAVDAAKAAVAAAQAAEARSAADAASAIARASAGSIADPQTAAVADVVQQLPPGWTSRRDDDGMLRYFDAEGNRVGQFNSDYLESLGLPSHATGLPYVPYDDYLFRAHQGEAVLTAPQAASWRADGSGELLAEVRALRAEVAGMRVENNSGNMTIARHGKRAVDLLDRVTTNGEAMVTREVTP